MKNPLSICIILVLFSNVLHSQIERGRILYNKSMEVNFIKDKSATIIKHGNEIRSSSLIDVNQKKVYKINYENQFPKSYKLVDLAKELTETEKFRLDAQLLASNFEEHGYGLVENDAKTILGYRCYKVKNFLGYSYCTDSIPSTVNIWPDFRKTEGGIPLEVFFNPSNDTLRALSIDDKVDIQFFNINFDQLINEDDINEISKIQEEKVNKTSKPKTSEKYDRSDMDFKPKTNEEDEKVIEDKTTSNLQPFHFEDSGLAMKAPTKFLKNPILEWIGAENLWFAKTKELLKSNENVEYLRLDTLNMQDRYTKIQSFFAPYFTGMNLALSSNDVDKDFVYSSSYQTKIGNHKAIVIQAKSKDLMVKYIIVFTDYTYVLTKILHKPNLPYFKSENIGEFLMYNDGFLSKYSKEMPISIDLDAEKFDFNKALSSYVSKDKGTVINFKLVRIENRTMFYILNNEVDDRFRINGNPTTSKNLCQGHESIQRLIPVLDPKIRKLYQQTIKIDGAYCIYLESLHYENSTMSIDEIKSIFEKCKFK